MGLPDQNPAIGARIGLIFPHSTYLPEFRHLRGETNGGKHPPTPSNCIPAVFFTQPTVTSGLASILGTKCFAITFQEPDVTAPRYDTYIQAHPPAFLPTLFSPDR